jgi:hypothetical protein
VRSNGNSVVEIYSRDLQEELARLREAGHRRVSVTASVSGEVVTFRAGIEKIKGTKYVLRPLDEAQEQLRQLHRQSRKPGRRKNPVSIFILGVEPL